MLLTERLELWRPEVGDMLEMHRLADNEEAQRFLGPEPDCEADSFARLMRNAGSWDLYGYGTFMLRARGQDRIIGGCGVFHSWRGFGRGMDDVPEAGWIVERDQWGQGLAGEAMRAILAWFDQAHGPRRITCMIEQGHQVSDRLAQSLGFRAYARHHLDDGGGPLIFYERLARPED
jgi:RimJ/RimL family protein N-acetyltransferase